jgi:hypothetical protein
MEGITWVTMECLREWNSLLVVLAGMFLVITWPMVKQHMISISLKGQGLLGMNEITVEGNGITHMQGRTVRILVEEFNHMDTIKTVATHSPLLLQQVLGCLGNIRQHMLVVILGDTSLHHMDLNSGSSDLMEVEHPPQDLTHTNHKTVMAP